MRPLGQDTVPGCTVELWACYLRRDDNDLAGLLARLGAERLPFQLRVCQRNSNVSLALQTPASLRLDSLAEPPMRRQTVAGPQGGSLMEEGDLHVLVGRPCVGELILAHIGGVAKLRTIFPSVPHPRHVGDPRFMSGDMA